MRYKIIKPLVPTVLRSVLLIISVCISVGAIAQQNTRAILLKGITGIPLPDPSNHICPSYIFDHQPEIITTAVVDEMEFIQFNNLVTAPLEKGKIVILGSSEYFRMPLIKDPNTRQLLKNLVLWGSNKNRPFIQLDEGSDSLRQFFASQQFSIAPKGNNLIDPSTNILFLSIDVADTARIKEIEMFVRRGGTLVFGSPLAELFEKNPESIPSLRLNDLFLKAGLCHTVNSFPYAVKNGALSDIPPTICTSIPS